MNNFLPISQDDIKKRGWSELDVIIVTGDAYVDHPSYGAAVIGRVLEDAGFKVGIIAQPDWRGLEDFKKLGRPRLFFGVTAGNIDSMIANYTASKKPRSDDDYSPGAMPGLRPDRATIMYTNKIKEAFPGAPVVLGGIEASLRRLAHYDYWSDKVRRSVLFDSKADILVYGMGEAATLQIAERLDKGENIKEIHDVRGTVVAKKNVEGLKDFVEIPSFEDISKDADKYNKAFKTIYDEADPFRGRTIVQKHGDRFAVQLPPPFPLNQKDLDRIYLLNYSYDWHPSYNSLGGVPGFETVRFSIISHRGCSGGCTFCSLFLHQGRIVQSRSEASILEEARRMARRNDFKGTITDIGGPTANLYMASCVNWAATGACRDKRCLVPEKCRDLKLGYEKTIELWHKVASIPKVKHVFIGSGLRYDLLVDQYSDHYLRELCAHHISGRLKVAPEHGVDSVLRLMGKPHFDKYEKFAARFNEMNARLGKKQYLTHYFLSAHPGASLEEALELGLYLAKKHINPEQIQDFIPLPMTLSSAIYHTGKDPFTGRPVHVARNPRERRLQRALIQSRQPQNRKYVIEALRRMKKMNLARLLLR